jgi:hypothetical protein
MSKPKSEVTNGKVSLDISAGDKALVLSVSGHQGNVYFKNLTAPWGQAEQYKIKTEIHFAYKNHMLELVE